MEQTERRMRMIVGAIVACKGNHVDCDQCWASQQVHSTSPTVCAMVEALTNHVEGIPDSVKGIYIAGTARKVR